MSEESVGGVKGDICLFLSQHCSFWLTPILSRCYLVKVLEGAGVKKGWENFEPPVSSCPIPLSLP